ncbi:MAG: hypothetical protein ACI9DH_001158 [Halioglobus sp.]|jgi:hypothetical protein
MSTSDLANEWSILQNQYDSYEKFSLVIKLLSIGVLSFSYFLHQIGLLTLALLLILWLQDAIWKTFQSRISIRLMDVERGLSADPSQSTSPLAAYQYNSVYARDRPGLLGLIREYLKHAVRPTIAYPHVVLVGVLVLYFFTGTFF